ncbi:helix-turn-helix domain-containing protein [Raineyella sp.]|nr:helix-turn-helix domain-containing protein [Raineyella sp.]MEA5154194.1 helix-turn-helix domain-containing protein [Raineyella sp.]
MGVWSDEAGDGMVPGAKGSRMTGEERERLMLAFVRRYRAGETVEALAAAAGRPEAFVEGLLREAGVALRRGRPTPSPMPDGSAPGMPVPEPAVLPPMVGAVGVVPVTGTAGVESASGADGVELATDIDGLELASGIAGVESASGIAGVEASVGIARVEPASGTVPTGQDGTRDLDWSPPPLTDWGLPTPPLKVLVKRKPKAREKALAAATARRKREASPDHDGTGAPGASFAGKKAAGGKKKSRKKPKKSGHR